MCSVRYLRNFEFWIRRLRQDSRIQPTRVDILTGYAEWAKSYPPEAHNPLMQLEQQAILSLLPADLTGQICLDLACGSGRYLKILQARQAALTVGLDISPHMLKRLSTISNQLTINNYLHLSSSFLQIPLPADSVDLITCGLAVGHAPELAPIVTEAARVLKPGGAFLYSDIHPFGTLAGWQRSFTATDGRLLSLEHYPHLYRDHQQACQSAGLSITAVLEPSLGSQAPSPHVADIPAVLIVRAEKTGSV